tara:strand:+ start:297032 stop:297532 length:501 start_codon:yes stop_codon:yes gene_type:complete
MFKRKEEVSSSKYINHKNLPKFNETNKMLFKAFPAITFEIEEIYGEGNSIVIFYRWTGAHKNVYPTGKNIMKTKQIWANLDVENIERTKTFYQSWGFQINGSPSNDLVSFFFGPDNFVIHFFKKEKLEEILEGKTSDLSQGNEVMFSLSVDTKIEYVATYSLKKSK